ncbi:RusA-like Holliday junction resolvase [Arthrobacter phage KBurrousTX]|uniref:RusA-like resolvase n=1 Tax=Arthrobacter phage KBurrousTX TaxID=2315608 RepID=A0A386K969_9CAUD|nr:RusA-like Holliday junction resolvase [Arthrobacter phage KBurrousTX]AYD81587.1 RusA-like resolvase [Arthrobacter phage KBurrousTX]
MMLHNPALTIMVTIPMTKALNMNKGMHWSKESPIIKELREQGGWLMREKHKGRNPYFDRCHVNAWVYFPDESRRRDTMNWLPTAKALQDGFVDGKLAPDDNERFVIGPHLWPTYELSGIKGMLKLRFEITHLEPIQ